MADKNRSTKLVRIQGKYYEVYPEKISYTRHKQHPKTGRFMGRYANVPQRYSDMVRYVQIKKPLDINKDGIIDLKKGQIIGRLSRDIDYKPHSIETRVHISNRENLKDRKKRQLERYRKKMIFQKERRRRK